MKSLQQLTSPVRGRAPWAAASVVLLTALALCPSLAVAQTESPPEAGPVEILPLTKVVPGMKATAWTAFEGRTPERLKREAAPCCAGGGFLLWLG